MSQSAAIITIKRPDQMTTKGAKEVAAWMRRQASFLERHFKKMAPNFRARYLYR